MCSCPWRSEIQSGNYIPAFFCADFPKNDTFQEKFSILYLENIQEEKAMTTGNMILIDDKKIYMSIPFCGDMEPEANGRVAYYLLQHLE